VNASDDSSNEKPAVDPKKRPKAAKSKAEKKKRKTNEEPGDDDDCQDPDHDPIVDGDGTDDDDGEGNGLEGDDGIPDHLRPTSKAKKRPAASKPQKKPAGSRKRDDHLSENAKVRYKQIYYMLIWSYIRYINFK